MSERTIVTVSNINDHYVMPLSVTLRSAAENLAPGWRLHAYILEEQTTPQNRQRLEQSLDGLPVMVTWLPVKLTQGVFTLGSHPGGVAATYFKLYMGDMLPPEVTRVIYLDADIIVCSDLLALWQTDLKGKMIAAVADCSWQWERMRALNLPEARFLEPGSYFNCGVMLVDLVLWRQADILSRAQYFADRYRKHLWLVDQDLINCIVDGKYVPVRPAWNLLDFYGNNYHKYWEMLRPSIYSRTMLEEANRNPCIIHYNGVEKPWEKWGSAHDPRWFMQYYAHTVWPGAGGMLSADFMPSAQMRHQGRILSMLKSFYRELELARFHPSILKDLAVYLCLHPLAVVALLRIIVRNSYWIIRAVIVPRIKAVRRPPFHG